MNIYKEVQTRRFRWLLQIYIWPTWSRRQCRFPRMQSAKGRHLAAVNKGWTFDWGRLSVLIRRDVLKPSPTPAKNKGLRANLLFVSTAPGSVLHREAKAIVQDKESQ